MPHKVPRLSSPVPPPHPAGPCSADCPHHQPLVATEARLCVLLDSSSLCPSFVTCTPCRRLRPVLDSLLALDEPLIDYKVRCNYALNSRKYWELKQSQAIERGNVIVVVHT